MTTHEENLIDKYILNMKESFNLRGNTGRFPNPIIVPSVMLTKINVKKSELYEYLLNSPLVRMRTTVYPTKVFEIL